MRQDIERNKNKQEYQFMQETIKKRPTERRSMARRLLASNNKRKASLGDVWNTDCWQLPAAEFFLADVQQLHLQKCFLSWQIKKRMHSRK